MLHRRLPLASALAVLGTTLGALLPVQAQSLKELYEAARGYDATYQSVRAAADAAVFKAEQSRALNRPLVNATGTVGFNDANTPYSSNTDTRTFQQSVGISAQQSLYNPANAKTIAQAERGIEVARAQLVAAEQDLIVRVSQAYFDVLGAADALATVRTNKRAVAEQLAAAKRNFEVGTATITDSREAQARFDLVTAQELAAENDLNVKRLALESLVGRQGLVPKPMAQPVVLPPLPMQDPEQWVNRAETDSPLLRQQQLALDVARLETEKAKAGRLPTVGASASITGAHTNLHATALTTVAAGMPPVPVSFKGSGSGLTSTIGVQLTLPLFTGGAVQNRIKETLSLEQKAQADLDAARRSLGQATRTAFFGVQSLRAQVGALEAAEASNKLALEATQLGYKVGVRVNIDVLNAQAQLNQTQRDLAKARYDVLVNSLKLRQAAGVLQPADVDAVNALLAR